MKTSVPVTRGQAMATATTIAPMSVLTTAATQTLREGKEACVGTFTF